MKTNIELTKKQFRVLMNALQIAGSVYAIMGDMVDEKYKKPSHELDELENYVLESADALGLSDMVEVFRGTKVASKELIDKAIDDLREYEEYTFWDNLARKLADRDLLRKLGKSKLRALSNLEYINAEYPLEDHYHKEFEKYGLNRLEIVKHTRPCTS
ncbi:MAG: hypothetical protein A2666_01645 [Parcubacteria group bacterium RIFCSPHIGHO2_01_FULL_47_10b]|nr:MAG: hypothetical protein A2666_01645 [Parcubacteria group bacterium RIFCSPHIGHO2_01_FULL_47_10b]